MLYSNFLLMIPMEIQEKKYPSIFTCLKVPTYINSQRAREEARERWAILTVAKSFCVMPLLCRPCWITLPTSRGTLSWCSSSVSRSSLAVFFVIKCCLFWPAAPIIQSNKNKRTNKVRLRAVPKNIKAVFLNTQLPRIPGNVQQFNVPTSARTSTRSCLPAAAQGKCYLNPIKC